MLAMTAGLADLGLGPIAARDPRRWECAAFRAANHDVGGSLPVLRVPQQLGRPGCCPRWARSGSLPGGRTLAAAAGLAVPVEKAFEVGVMKIIQRRRPAQVLATELHDDAPTEGPSYPSGHAALATCAAVLAAAYLPGYAADGFALAAGLTSFARVHQGAHFPLDAVGGVFLGVGVGAALTYVVGLPGRT